MKRSVADVVARLEWDESCLTGHTIIDIQHAQLFISIVELARTIDFDDLGPFSIALINMNDVVKVHLHTEELILKERVPLPVFLSHKVEHDKCRDIMSKFDVSKEKWVKKKDRNRIVFFLTSWWLDHVKGKDIPLFGIQECR